MAKPQLRNKPIKKKANPLKSAKIESIDYKDTALLRKFISDRGKIRARRVTGVSTQEQRMNRVSPSFHSPLWRSKERGVDATVKSATGAPLCVQRSSGSLVKLPMIVMTVSPAIGSPWWAV